MFTECRGEFVGEDATDEFGKASLVNRANEASASDKSSLKKRPIRDHTAGIDVVISASA